MVRIGHIDREQAEISTIWCNEEKESMNWDGTCSFDGMCMYALVSSPTVCKTSCLLLDLWRHA